MVGYPWHGTHLRDLCVHAGGRDRERVSYDKRRVARDIIKQTTCHLDDDPVWHSPSLPTSFIQLELSWARAFDSTFPACLIQISGRDSSIFSGRGLLPTIIIINRELYPSKSLAFLIFAILTFFPPIYLPHLNDCIWQKRLLRDRWVRLSKEAHKKRSICTGIVPINLNKLQRQNHLTNQLILFHILKSCQEGYNLFHEFN